MRGDPCIRIDGGHDAAGHARETLDVPALDRAIDRLDGSAGAFAVAGMFAVRNPDHEIAVRDRLRERTGLPVTCGHELSSRLDGPRRAMTCVLNARLVPIVQRLLNAAERSFDALGIRAPTMVVRGDGALVGAEVARTKPVETILSGPAASLVGAAHLTGERDAVVSDIGGTTTDYALLAQGRPRLDPDGATVGGFRTMVEAVAMRTVGLGGDSEVRWGYRGDGQVQWEPRGGGPVRGESATRGGNGDPGLNVGPRRLVPLSLLATEHPDLVADTLERQRAGPRRGGDVGRFALRVGSSDRVVDGASRREAALLVRLASGPVALDRLVESQAEAGALDSLVGRGHVMLCGVTPSDAAHVLGMHDGWNADAALAGISLFAEQLDSRGAVIAPDAEAMSRAIVDALVERSAEALLDAACDHDGHGFADLGRHLLRAATNSGRGAFVDFSVRLDRPVIGLGAPAPAYYPAVAARLGTRAVVPGHAGVANAVGAVVGRVRIRARGTITRPDDGLYRVFAGAGPRDFPTLEAATAHARHTLETRARQGAIDAGAGETEVSFDHRDEVAVIEGRETLVERILTAVASGRPRIAGH